MGDEILADPALSTEQDRGIGIGDVLHHHPDRSHGGAASGPKSWRTRLQGERVASGA